MSSLFVNPSSHNLLFCTKFSCSELVPGFNIINLLLYGYSKHIQKCSDYFRDWQPSLIMPNLIGAFHYRSICKTYMYHEKTSVCFSRVAVFKKEKRKRYFAHIFNNNNELNRIFDIVDTLFGPTLWV